jgi:hypothetical protein
METTGNIDGKRRTVDLLLGAVGHRLGHRRSGWPHRLGVGGVCRSTPAARFFPFAETSRQCRLAMHLGEARGPERTVSSFSGFATFSASRTTSRVVAY